MVLFGFVLLCSGGALCAATQNDSDINTDASLNQIPVEQTQMTDQETNLMEQGAPAYYPGSYRLRSYQLRKAAVITQTPPQPHMEEIQTTEGLQRSEVGELTSEQLELGEAAQPTEEPDLSKVT